MSGDNTSDSVFDAEGLLDDSDDCNDGFFDIVDEEDSNRDVVDNEGCDDDWNTEGLLDGSDDDNNGFFDCSDDGINGFFDGSDDGNNVFYDNFDAQKLKINKFEDRFLKN